MRWRQEQRVGSNTYHESQAARALGRHLFKDSEALERPYGVSVPGARDQMSAERILTNRMPAHSMTTQGFYDRTQYYMYARNDALSLRINDGAPPGYVRQGDYYVTISFPEHSCEPR